MPDLFRLKLVSKRQVTISQRILDLLGLRLGDEIHLKIANGKIIQAYPVKIGPDEEMSDDAKQRFAEIEKESTASDVAGTDITELMNQYSTPQKFTQYGDPTFNLNDLFPPACDYRYPGFPSPLPGQCGLLTPLRVPPRNFKRSDERIAELVAESLANGQIDLSDVEVFVENGVVTLQGRINDKRSRLVAELAARNVLGVKDVQNNIVADVSIEFVDYRRPGPPEVKVKVK